MTLTTAYITELAKLAPSAIVELFELHLSTELHGSCQIYRFHAGVNERTISGHVVWAGTPYYAWPIEADGFSWEGSGVLPRPRLRIANGGGLISQAMLEVRAMTGGDLTGAKLIRLRTLRRFLDAVNFEGGNATADPTASAPAEIYFIDRLSGETTDVVEFELASAFDLAGVRVPKRQVLASTCQWRYRRWTGAVWDYTGVNCPYAGAAYFNEADGAVGSAAQDVCGKRLTSCEARFGAGNELPFGAFPGAGTSFGTAG
jgi:lambda family phage minor tail protein L